MWDTIHIRWNSLRLQYQLTEYCNTLPPFLISLSLSLSVCLCLPSPPYLCQYGVNIFLLYHRVLWLEDSVCSMTDHLQHLVFPNSFMTINKTTWKERTHYIKKESFFLYYYYYFFSPLFPLFTLLYYNLIKVQLHLCPLHYPLLHRVIRYETKYLHLFHLPDTMSPVLGLEVNLRVPVTIVEYNDVGRSQIDAETPRTGWEHENKFLAPGAVEVIDWLLPVGVGRLTIKSTVLVTKKLIII